MVTDSRKSDNLILITGATGYIGGRLFRKLEQAGHRLRLFVRRPEALEGRVAKTTELVKGDLFDTNALETALRDVNTAYYLVHSMAAGTTFEEQDRTVARNFADAARKAGVKRIIYLGGLADENVELSRHLRSRHEVGGILRASGCEVIEFRASIVIGSGSASFEMIRHLTERLPVMITPKWVTVPAQPIAVEDLLEYLTSVLDVQFGENQIIEIGGADVVSYGELMREYARQRRLKRWMIPVPVLTPRLSSLWLGLVTPLYARIGRALIDSVRHPTIVNHPDGMSQFDLKPVGYREAISSALRNEDREFAQTRWSDALSSAGYRQDWGGARFGSRIVDSRTAVVTVNAKDAFRPIRKIGGDSGWYFGNGLWRLRGFIDILFGGIGLRRGRRHPEKISVGDALDFWRVEAYQPDRLLRLSAEMKVPGRAWLEFEVTPSGSQTVIRQTAIFDPVGITGLAYWYALYPLHQFVFAGMLRSIARKAQTGEPIGAGNKVSEQDR